MLFDRQGEKKYMVGMDLRDEACQISWCRSQKGRLLQEPVTYARVPGSGKFDIPMALCKTAGENQWFYGEEAVEHSAEENRIFIPRLLSLALDGSPVAIDETEYDPAALLALYVNRCLQELEQGIPGGIAAVMFTARTMDSRTIELLENVRKRLDLKASVYYQSFAGSFYDFMLNQDESLREPAAALFDYETGGRLRVTKLIFNPHTTPVVSYLEENEYPGLFAKDDAGRDREFAGILREELAGHNFSSVYLVGSGFKGGWMKKSTVFLCQGRRAFLGGNLFSKGAAYGAVFKEEKPEILSRYLFLDQNKLRSNILMKALDRGELARISLVDAGVNWYEVRSSADVILDSTAEINLILHPLTGGKEEPFHIRLDRLPVREGRMTRVRLEFSMLSAIKLHIQIEDLGFGEIFPSSGLKWEQDLTLADD